MITEPRSAKVTLTPMKGGVHAVHIEVSAACSDEDLMLCLATFVRGFACKLEVSEGQLIGMLQDTLDETSTVGLRGDYG